MGWFLSGLLIYFVTIIAESALAAVSPQEAEQLRIDSNRSAQRAFTLTRQIKPAMAAMLLARILLKLLLAVFSITWLFQLDFVRAALNNAALQLHLPEIFLKILAGLLPALLLAFLFWGLKNLDFTKRFDNHKIFILKRLSLYITLWKNFFTPFLNIKKTDEQIEKEETGEPVGSTLNYASEKREIELLKSIVKFGDVTVKQVMQPRSKVVAVEFRTGFHDLLASVREAGFSRLPIYQEDLDNITGILYVKDLLPYLDKPDEFEWQSLIRTNVLLAPESKRGTELLQDFKKQKIHMAIVVDEYGGSSGIITLEDVLEEVTGEIRDEFDEESEVRYRKIDDYNYLFEGQTLLNDVCRITGLNAGTFDEAKGAADTLAGLALELKGDIPKTGSEIGWNGFLLTVTAANNRRIEQLKLTLPRLHNS